MARWIQIDYINKDEKQLEVYFIKRKSLNNYVLNKYKGNVPLKHFLELSDSSDIGKILRSNDLVIGFDYYLYKTEKYDNE